MSSKNIHGGLKEKVKTPNVQGSQQEEGTLEIKGSALIFGGVQPLSNCESPERAFGSVVEVGLVFMCSCVPHDTLR